MGAQHRPARLIIHVQTQAEGKPIAGASVHLVGTTHAGLADDTGVAVLPAVPSGRHTLVVESIGYGTERRGVRLPAGSVTEIFIRLTAQPIKLKEIRVEIERRVAPGPLAQFYERRHRGIGRFITRADIEKTHARRFSDVLRMVPGMRFDCGSFMDNCEAAMRSAPASLTNEVRTGVNRLASVDCPIQYYVDGLYQPYRDVNNLRLQDIDAVEVYVHGEEAPARYSMRKSARCGVVLVWMRRSLAR